MTAGRGKLLFIFNPRSALLVSGDMSYRDPPPLVYAKVLEVKPGFVVDTPARSPHTVRTSLPASSRNMQFGGSARFTMQLGPQTTLTSLTAYRELDYELVVDADITELDLTISNVHENQHQISEELTITRQQSRVRWIGGAFLLKDIDRQPTLVHVRQPRVINLLNPRVDAGRSGVRAGHLRADARSFQRPLVCATQANARRPSTRESDSRSTCLGL